MFQVEPRFARLREYAVDGETSMMWDLIWGEVPDVNAEEAGPSMATTVDDSGPLDSDIDDN